MTSQVMADLISYPVETILHRLYIQGNKLHVIVMTIFDHIVMTLLSKNLLLFSFDFVMNFLNICCFIYLFFFSN